MQVVLYEGLGDLPHFTPDLDNEASPAPVVRWRELLQSADGVIICTPEYAFGVPGVLKNALDWVVSSGEFYEKPTAVISASPLMSGGDKAHTLLMLTFQALTARIAEDAKLTVPAVNKKLTPENEISDPPLKESLEKLLAALAKTIDDKESES